MEVTADGGLIGIFRVDIADDAMVHIVSGIPGVSGTYHGRDRLNAVMKAFNRAVNGQFRYEVRELWPLDPQPEDTFVVSVHDLIVGEGSNEKIWPQVAIGRREKERIVEGWLISASVADESAGRFVAMRELLSRPFALECSACERTSDASLGDVLRAMFPVTFFRPTPRYPLLLKCPSCGRRSWMSLSLPILHLRLIGRK
jgi:hypothetical protein